MKRFLLILVLSFAYFLSHGQVDSTPQIETIDTGVAKPVKRTPKPVRKRIVVDTSRSLIDSARVDSLSRDSSISVDTIAPPVIQNNTVAAAPAIKRPIDSFYLKMLDNPFLRTKNKPVYLVINERERESKDELFYLMSGMLLFLAFIKLVFSQYFSNIFRLFFQPSFRQKQTREQLAQNNLPSLLLNIFFIFSAAAFVSLLLRYYGLTNIDFNEIFVTSAACLLILYAGKFILLSLMGWIFDVSEMTSTYIFIVYLINKIIGVILIPFTLIIAFSQPMIINGFITISLLLLVLLFLYRYFVSFTTVRGEVRMNALHFLLYVCAFEVTPLLLIYKTLSIYLDKSA